MQVPVDDVNESSSVSRRVFLRKLAAASAVAGTGVAATGSMLSVPKEVLAATDQLVKVSSTDPTADLLNNKVTTQGITKRVAVTPGTNYQTLELAGMMPSIYLIFKDASGAVKSYKWDGTVGTTTPPVGGGDAATLINGAISDLSTQRGGRVFIRNAGDNSPYLINSQIVFKPYVEVESDSATLKNNTAMQFPFASERPSILYRAKIRGLVLDVNNAYHGVGLSLFAAQRSVFDVAIKNCWVGADIQGAPLAPAPVELVLQKHTVLSTFNIQVDRAVGNCALQLLGDPASGAIVTDNQFEFFSATQVGANDTTGTSAQGDPSGAATGIRFHSWCDSNRFDNAFISLSANNSIGVVLNDTQPGGPGVPAGVYNIQFDKLSIDALHPCGLTGVTGLYINNSSQLQIHQLFGGLVDSACNPIPWPPGAWINDKGGISYDIGDYLTNHPSIHIVRKGFV